MSAVDRLPPVSLADLNAEAELLTRVDRKYVVPAGDLDAFVTGVPGLRVLTIDGRRSSHYESTYLDTVGLDSWTASAHRRRRRWKVRSRAAGTGLWDATTLHDISVELDEEEYAAMIATYEETDEKEWIEATVTIDGEVVERAGLRLEGNSSLRSVSADAEPTDLPWLIRLDKFIDGHSIDGWTGLVERAVATSFSVNGADARLRLIVQHLDERWEEENFSTPGLLYKAEAGGDWSWRGDDPDAYTDVFDQETGDAELPERLDVQAFARYLAFEEVVDNFDDIDGPGNNAYLRYDATTGGFTLVAWDHNLAFGTSPRGGGFSGGGFPEDGERPEGMPTEMPDGERPQGMPEGGPGGMRGGFNVLVERFSAVEEWADLVEQARSDLVEELYDSGYAEQVLDQWVTVLTEQAGDLVDAATVEEEADAIRDVIS